MSSSLTVIAVVEGSVVDDDDPLLLLFASLTSSAAACDGGGIFKTACAYPNRCGVVVDGPPTSFVEEDELLVVAADCPVVTFVIVDNDNAGKSAAFNSTGRMDPASFVFVFRLLLFFLPL